MSNEKKFHSMNRDLIKKILIPFIKIIIMRNQKQVYCSRSIITTALGVNLKSKTFDNILQSLKNEKGFSDFYFSKLN